ncbi:Flavin monooxygenase-like, partial [Dillenia turbinata]
MAAMTMSNLSITKPKISHNVAVIGAGAAGLTAARELRLEGHNVVVFERLSKIGGTWAYNPNTESDPLGIDPNRKIILSSLYDSLRTNLPRESMGYRAYPFVEAGLKDRDQRRYPGHKEVLDYLEDYAREFRVSEMVRFETEVVRVGMVEGRKWEVKWRALGKRIDVDEVFDAVVICNGHYTEPRLAYIPGIDEWPGKQMHSHNYRVPEPFRDQVVILIGSSASAADISRDIAGVAKEVHVASRSSAALGKLPGYENIWLHSMIGSAHQDGSVAFQDGNIVQADVIMHCTGYKYHFPFLETNGIVNVDDNRVGPLYQHVFPPALAPWLSFVGLPWKVIPFPLCEYQSKWIAGVLSGRILLPSKEKMMESVKAFYTKLGASGMPKHYAHNMGTYQFEYNDWLAGRCGCAGTEEWRKQMYAASSESKRIKPETYRDEWEDHEWISQAHEDFKQCGHLSESK